MKIKYLNIIITFLLFSVEINSVSGNERKQEGIGILIEKHDDYLGEKLHFPENSSIDVYNSKHKIIGKINSIKFRPILNINNQKSFINTEMIAYDGIAIIFYLNNENFYEIKAENINYSIWVKNSDLAKIGLEPYLWINFFKKFQKHLYPLTPLNLRSAPQNTGDKIALVKDERFEIILTGKIKNNWAQANIREYVNNEQDCGLNPKVLKEYTGWIKIIDDNGTPNVWFYPKGC
ncbi:hypothetical protein [Leptospira brenneri]|uniref:hypothetical protein n=1 Tax=Leptospira brenneri TaxID=2023182 RepID=UPI000C29E058|nr:hypothetical protein [Leptospira brenneri]PJZ43752.1 hypothetical protein CH361_18540 [Leptospira brenneri]